MQYFHSDMDLEFVLTQDTNTVYEKHNHVSKYVAGLILEGSVDILEKEKTTRCCVDDFFVIPVYAVHSLELKSKETRLLTMCAGISFIEKYRSNREEGLLSRYTQELQKQGIINHRQAEAFEEAMDIILRYYIEEKIAFPEHIESIKERIMSDTASELRLDELAEQIYISKYYLIRQFKETIGLTPHSFQLQNRIRKSQHMLSEGWKIADVAAELGFYDQSHYIKCFKNIVGLTPGEYIDSLKRI